MERESERESGGLHGKHAARARTVFMTVFMVLRYIRASVAINVTGVGGDCECTADTDCDEIGPQLTG